MHELLGLLLANAAAAGLLAAAAWALSRRLRRQALVHGLWVVALLRLVAPPILPLPLVPAWTLPDLSLRPEGPAVVLLDAAPPEAGRDPMSPSIGERLGKSAFAAEIAATRMRPSGRAADRGAVSASPKGPSTLTGLSGPASVPAGYVSPAPDPSSVAAFGLLTGALVVLALATSRIRRFHRLLRHAAPAPPALADRVRDLAARIGLRVAPPASLLPARVPPMLWPARGGPRLLMPADLMLQLSDEERDALLLHELAHVRRRDHWVRLLELAATALFWWYPVTWWARRALRRAEERCCDEWVLRLMPGSAPAYAEGLLKSLTFVAAEPDALPLGASGAGPVRDLETRLKEIMMTRPNPRLATPARVALAVAAVVGLVVFPTQARPRTTLDEATVVPASERSPGRGADADPETTAESRAVLADAPPPLPPAAPAASLPPAPLRAPAAPALPDQPGPHPAPASAAPPAGPLPPAAPAGSAAPRPALPPPARRAPAPRSASAPEAESAPRAPAVPAAPRPVVAAAPSAPVSPAPAPAPALAPHGQSGEPDSTEREIEEQSRLLEEQRRQLQRQELELARRSLEVEERRQREHLRAEADRLRASGQTEEAGRLEARAEFLATRLDVERRRLELEEARIGAERAHERDLRSLHQTLHGLERDGRQAEAARVRMKIARLEQQNAERAFELERQQMALQSEAIEAEHRAQAAELEAAGARARDSEHAPLAALEAELERARRRHEREIGRHERELEFRASEQALQAKELEALALERDGRAAEAEHVRTEAERMRRELERVQFGLHAEHLLEASADLEGQLAAQLEALRHLKAEGGTPADEIEREITRLEAALEALHDVEPR